MVDPVDRVEDDAEEACAEDVEGSVVVGVDDAIGLSAGASVGLSE